MTDSRVDKLADSYRSKDNRYSADDDDRAYATQIIHRLESAGLLVLDSDDPRAQFILTSDEAEANQKAFGP